MGSIGLGADSGSDIEARRIGRQRQSETPGRPHSEDHHRPPSPTGPLSRLEHLFLEHMLRILGAPAVRIVLWNGDQIGATDQTSPIDVHVRNRATLWRMLADPSYQFAEAYCDGRADVNGDLLPLLESLNRALQRAPQPHSAMRRLVRWQHRPHINTLRGSRENIHRHYDIGNEFYKLWLDEQLVYTCAYFPTRETTLEQAQIAKMDHVCRKLRLQPGETVIEAGAGWGALSLHMARHYGVTVRAFNISHEQIAYARQRARNEGLDSRVEFIEDDWRSVAGHCDVFVSVGMLEHVGLPNYHQLGRLIDNTLLPGGRGLIHSIGQNQHRPFDRWTERHIFPGAYPPTLAEMMTIFEPFQFSIHDIENLRLHYAETTLHWLRRFEAHADDARKMFDDRFVRMWRLYLAASTAAFRTNNLQLYQLLFARGTNNSLPLTREYQYTPTTHPKIETWTAGDGNHHGTV